jgi:NADPH:quinone reductase-like Zn-dependent oxidoreductase
VEASRRALGYPGVLSEYVSLPESWFVRASATLDPAEASTLPASGLTAWFTLVENGKLKAGDIVVVQGTGGVALFALQIAKAHGATVIVTSDSPEKSERVMRLGADHFIDREGWVESVYQLTGDYGADNILELTGGANVGEALRAVAVGGISP